MNGVMIFLSIVTVAILYDISKFIRNMFMDDDPFDIVQLFLGIAITLLIIFTKVIQQYQM